MAAVGQQQQSIYRTPSAVMNQNHLHQQMQQQQQQGSPMTYVNQNHVPEGVYGERPGYAQTTPNGGYMYDEYGYHVVPPPPMANAQVQVRIASFFFKSFFFGFIFQRLPVVPIDTVRSWTINVKTEKSWRAERRHWCHFIGLCSLFQKTPIITSQTTNRPARRCI
jgi:hypothetical protein